MKKQYINQINKILKNCSLTELCAIYNALYDIKEQNELQRKNHSFIRKGKQ